MNIYIYYIYIFKKAYILLKIDRCGFQKFTVKIPWQELMGMCFYLFIYLLLLLFIYLYIYLFIFTIYYISIPIFFFHKFVYGKAAYG